MLIDIYKDNIGFVTDEVSTIKTNESNLNEANRIKFVTDLAAVSRGKSESKNPPARYKSLLKEAAPTYKEYSSSDKEKYQGSPSRPLEFLPVVLRCYVGDQGKILLTKKVKTTSKLDINTINRDVYHTLTKMEFYNYLIRFSYVECDEDNKEMVIYTNMRTCINVGIPYKDIPYNTPDEIKDFKAIKARIPMFTWAQVPNTHTMISKEAETDRHKTKPLYWLPKGFRQHVYDYTLKEDTNVLYKAVCEHILILKTYDEIIDVLVSGSFVALSAEVLQGFFKAIGYPAEIYQRAMYYFKYKTVVMTGWHNDPKVWKHLFIERSTMPDIWDNWTQAPAKQFVAAIKDIVMEQ